MTPQPFQGEVLIRGVSDAFLSIVLLMLMAAPFLVSIFANIGRRAWPTYRKRQEVRPRAMLAAPRRIA
jgi:hypothetical protein